MRIHTALTWMALLSALVFEGLCGQLIQEMGRFGEHPLFTEYSEYSSTRSVLAFRFSKILKFHGFLEKLVFWVNPSEENGQFVVQSNFARNG